MKQYIVDAFTDEPFTGNPAAVCVMDTWPADESMMKLAMENNLSETAFIVKEEQGYRLRWFTPGAEVELCGHATLASSFVILNYYEPDSDVVRFDTLSGILTVRRNGNLYEMDFPTDDLREVPVTDEMEAAFGVRPVKALLGMDLNCVFETEEHVKLLPDGAIRILVTADLETIKDRFAARMHGNLPAPVSLMLERKHGVFDSGEYDYCFDGVSGDAKAFSEVLKSDWCEKRCGCNE